MAVKITLTPLQILVPEPEAILTVGVEVLVIVKVMILEVACVVDTQAELDIITTVIALLLARVLVV